MSLDLKLEIWIIITIFTYILGFIQIYGTFKFKSLYNLLIVEKRYPQLVIIETVASMILLFIGIPLWVHSLFEATETHSGIDELEQFIEYAGFIVISFAAHFVANIETVRLWLMSYDLHYLRSSDNEAWKSVVDASFADKDWYLKHRATFGSKHYVASRVFIYYLCAATLGSTALIITNGPQLYIGQCIDVMLYGTPVAFTIFLYYRCPKKLNDNFLFHYEFKTSAILFGTGFIIYFIAWILYFCGYKVLNVIIMALDCVWTVTLPSLFSTIWIPRKILTNNVWVAAIQNRVSNYSLTESYRQNSQRKHSEDKVSVIKKVLNTLKDEQNFESFVKWMYREFSSETILCFIECVQFKALASAHLEKDTNVEAKPTTKEFVFYETIPKSSIVYMCCGEQLETNMDEAQFKKAAHLLFEKYIKIYSELEVNISSSLRSWYYALEESNYEAIEPSQISTMFDDVIEEMFKFMQQSFARYQQQTSINLLNNGLDIL